MVNGTLAEMGLQIFLWDLNDLVSCSSKHKHAIVSSVLKQVLGCSEMFCEHSPTSLRLVAIVSLEESSTTYNPPRFGH